MQTPAQPIHPFPARMASEIALAEVASLPPGSRVLDPMAGSGTVVRVASDQGHRAIGFDLDPLAVLMAKVWTTAVDADQLRKEAATLVGRVRREPSTGVSLPWVDGDPDTHAFVDYWFAKAQQADLRRLSAALQGVTGPVGDALRLGLSRIIVTKDRGASLARDVSHSRPHRVRTENDFPVLDEYLRSIARLAQQLEEQQPSGNAVVELGDARNLSAVETASVDAVVTSPPYLNAIDYLRGHRLALVWLGHRLGDLRTLRAESIGTERQPDDDTGFALARDLTAPLEPLDRLPSRQRQMVDRYVLDLYAMLTELHRVLRPGGRAILVIGNSCIRGVFVKNARALVAAAQRAGFDLLKEAERVLPPNRRYLPPPHELEPSDLEKRMRSETVLTFVRPASRNGVLSF